MIKFGLRTLVHLLQTSHLQVQIQGILSWNLLFYTIIIRISGNVWIIRVYASLWNGHSVVLVRIYSLGMSIPNLQIHSSLRLQAVGIDSEHQILKPRPQARDVGHEP